ncbi:hypothetical protein [Marinospirillum sp.]|nr:hypothetical protein [Marinospirillum sp.]
MWQLPNWQAGLSSVMLGVQQLAGSPASITRRDYSQWVTAQ